MIIECVNCNKKFNVDSKLIPPEGRQIQCGSCNHNWHYIIKEKSTKKLIIDEAEKTHETILHETQKNLDNEIKPSAIIKEDVDKKELDKKIENKGISNFFSYLLVIIISFVALLILIDTLKTPLINIFPGLEIILFNLFETLKDVKLFIIDLK